MCLFISSHLPLVMHWLGGVSHHGGRLPLLNLGCILDNYHKKGETAVLSNNPSVSACKKKKKKTFSTNVAFCVGGYRYRYRFLN